MPRCMHTLKVPVTGLSGLVLMFAVMTVQSSTLVKVLEGELDADSRQTHLNALKMNCYLMCQFCQKFETAVTKPSNAVTTVAVKVSSLRQGITIPYYHVNFYRL